MKVKLKDIAQACKIPRNMQFKNTLMLFRKTKKGEEQREVIKNRHFLSPGARPLSSIRIPLVLQTSALDSGLFI